MLIPLNFFYIPTTSGQFWLQRGWWTWPILFFLWGLFYFVTKLWARSWFQSGCTSIKPLIVDHVTIFSWLVWSVLTSTDSISGIWESSHRLVYHKIESASLQFDLSPLVCKWYARWHASSKSKSLSTAAHMSGSFDLHESWLAFNCTW